ncbi:MAG: hypothetical protein PHX54_04935 [Lentimicrobiaceae bacterium]|nr:hypothetical protein [Lentimicrobiaceae bacterium]
MWILIVIAVVFLVGLLAREKGDGFLDTMGEGCSLSMGCIVLIVAIVIIAAVVYAIGS